MRTIYINSEQINSRIDNILMDSFPQMPQNAMYKAFRKKDIKANGKRIRENYVTNAGDKIDIYISDEILDGVPENKEHKLNMAFDIVYEDGNILVVNKKQGVPVHPDRNQSQNTLIDLIRLYLEKKGEYHPHIPDSFSPSLCHRIDRNTGGLVIIAKNKETLKILLNKIKTNQIKKYYQCLVKGSMKEKHSTLKAYLVKDAKKSCVHIKTQPQKGAFKILTEYKVLSFKSDISRLEVQLLTGRTHQIRAHLAHEGHPIIGDDKYGSKKFNRSIGVKYQALWAYKIVFDFKDTGILSYLGGKTFTVEPDFPLKV